MESVVKILAVEEPIAKIREVFITANSDLESLTMVSMVGAD
jgi:hypothetical protein